MKRTLGYAVFSTLLVWMLLPGTVSAQTESESALKPGNKLIVGVLVDPPYIIKDKSGEWTGLNVEIWKNVAKTLNLNYEFREMDFDELIGALHDKKIDISIESFFIMSEREKLIDFSHPLGNTRVALATVGERIQHPWYTAIKMVFSWGTLKVFAMLGAALFFLGFLMWLIERKQNPDHFGGGTIRGIGSGIYWVGSTLASGVCFGVALKSIPARLIGLVWMMICALAISALIASLASALTESRSSVEVIGDETIYSMHTGAVRDGVGSSFLKDLGGEYTLYGDVEDGMNALLKDEIDGFLWDEITLNYFMQTTYKDKISVYPTNIKRYSFAFGLPPESPLRRGINYALVNLMEKPKWLLLMKKYGLEENYEPRQKFKRRRTQYE